jgi:hypothetical protein
MVGETKHAKYKINYDGPLALLFRLIWIVEVL